MQPVLVGGWRFGPEDGFQVYLSYMQVLIALITVVSMTVLTYSSPARGWVGLPGLFPGSGHGQPAGYRYRPGDFHDFRVGRGLAAVAGVLVSCMYYGLVNPFIGFIAGLKAFTAAVLGGIGSIPGRCWAGGARAGGSFASAYLRTEYKDVVAFALLIGVLLVRPSGLLGRPDVEKV